jgi:oligopeptide/dipeptide ABC transporter ATP-binding protein
VIEIVSPGDESWEKLLIADEPTTALDVTIQAQILSLLDQIKRELGMGIILITHDMRVIAERADRVVVMYAGKKVEAAETVELFKRVRHPYTEALLASIPQFDQDKTQELYSIPGLPPDLRWPPLACRFAPRCAFATEQCRTEDPPLAADDPVHPYACFHPRDSSASEMGELGAALIALGREEQDPGGVVRQRARTARNGPRTAARGDTRAKPRASPQEGASPSRSRRAAVAVEPALGLSLSDTLSAGPGEVREGGSSVTPVRRTAPGCLPLSDAAAARESGRDRLRTMMAQLPESAQADIAYVKCSFVPMDQSSRTSARRIQDRRYQPLHCPERIGEVAEWLKALAC